MVVMEKTMVTKKVIEDRVEVTGARAITATTISTKARVMVDTVITTNMDTRIMATKNITADTATNMASITTKTEVMDMDVTIDHITDPMDITDLMLTDMDHMLTTLNHMSRLLLI